MYEQDKDKHLYLSICSIVHAFKFFDMCIFSIMIYNFAKHKWGNFFIVASILWLKKKKKYTFHMVYACLLKSVSDSTYRNL